MLVYEAPVVRGASGCRRPVRNWTTRLAATLDADFMWLGRHVEDLPGFGELVTFPALVVLADIVRSAAGELSDCSPIEDMVWLVLSRDIRLLDLSLEVFFRSVLGLEALAGGTATCEGCGGGTFAAGMVPTSPLAGQIFPNAASMLPMLDWLRR